MSTPVPDPREARAAAKRSASRGMDDGWTVTGTLITGIGFWGFVGWALSRWTGWVGWFPMGVILGAAAGVYLVYKQAAAPPPLLDISKAQDGGLAARHARRVAEQEAEGKQPDPADAADDEGHTESGRQ